MKLKRLFFNSLMLLFASVFLCSSDSGCEGFTEEEIDYEYTLHASPSSLSISAYGGHYTFKVWMTNKKGDKVKGKVKVSSIDQGTNLTFDDGKYFSTYYYFTSSEPVATVGFTIDKNSYKERNVDFEISSTSNDAKSIRVNSKQSATIF